MLKTPQVKQVPSPQTTLPQSPSTRSRPTPPPLLSARNPRNRTPRRRSQSNTPDPYSLPNPPKSSYSRRPPIPQLTPPAPNPNTALRIKEARAPPSQNPRRKPQSPGPLEPTHHVCQAGKQEAGRFRRAQRRSGGSSRGQRRRAGSGWASARRRSRAGARGGCGVGLAAAIRRSGEGGYRGAC